ncbi:hypothetical protein [Delftia tsuruhatensis]|uniref:hypothetical protein n=1 Tax=Delftia tsuruhatensis TaxID=180282 RepID=UPI001EF67EFA|nr:hypothetical protein [Delftia tsuruhatensis]
MNAPIRMDMPAFPECGFSTDSLASPRFRRCLAEVSRRPVTDDMDIDGVPSTRKALPMRWHAPQWMARVLDAVFFNILE